MKRLPTIGVAFITAALAMTGCSDDDNDFFIDDSHLPDIEEGGYDISGGVNVLMVDVNQADHFRHKLGTKRNIRVKADDSFPYTVKVVTDNDTSRFITLESKNGNHPVLTRNITGTIHLELADGSHRKDVKIALRDKASGPKDIGEYAYSIGCGTKIWDEPGNITYPIVDFNNIYDHLANNVNNVQEGVHFEIGGEMYHETMDKMSFNFGIAGSCPKFKDVVFSGSGSFNMEQCTHNINNMEFYLGYYSKVMAEVKINTDYFAQYVADGTLYTCLDSLTNEALNNPRSAAYQNYSNDSTGVSKLLKHYGAHVITQASFGGSYIYMYGRKANAYEQSVGHDASANIKFKFIEGGAAESWLKEYQNKHNSPYIQYDFGGSDYSSDYREASGYIEMIKATGGDANTDITAWENKFSTEAPDKWVIVSFLTKDTEGDDGGLLEITDFIYDPERKAAVKKYFDGCVNALGEKMSEARIVLADFMMVAVENDGNGNIGKPGPIVQKGLDGKKYIYFPVRANDRAKTDDGYALQTHQDEYVVTTGTNKHYWYYALGYDHECNGFTNVRFDNKTHSGWERRGNHADEGVPGALDNNYVMVYPGTSTTPYEDKVKAIALMDESDNGTDGKVGQRLIGSTGGAEKKAPFQSTENIENFNNYWTGQMRYDKTRFYEGGLVFNQRFYIVYQTKELPLKALNFGELNNFGQVQHPKKWGE